MFSYPYHSFGSGFEGYTILSYRITVISIQHYFWAFSIIFRFVVCPPLEFHVSYSFQFIVLINGNI